MSDGGDVVKRITISANGEGIDSTTDSVNALGNAFDNTSSKSTSLANIATGIAAVGLAVTGAIAGLRGFIDLIGEQSKSLSDLADHAALASMSTKEFQQTMFAAMSQGVSEKDYTSGMAKIASDVTEASRGTTEFTKLLEANGMSILKNADDATKMKSAMSDIMSLFQGASPAIASRMAQILGVSQAWIPFLKEGTNQFEEQKKAALGLGVIIDDSTISKAKQFSDEWHKATATWDLQFKSSLASILPLLNQLAQVAITIMNNVGDFGSGIARLFTADDKMNTKQLSDQIALVERIQKIVAEVGPDASMGPKGESVGFLERLVGLPPGSTVADINALIDKLKGLQNDKMGGAKRVDVAGGSTVLSPIEQQNDAVDRAINSLNKHIESQKADVLAVGQGAAALAGYRVEAAQTAAVLANGGKITDDQIAKFAKLKIEAEGTAKALADAKISSEISRSKQLLFATDEDVKIANQLKEKYGDDIPTALASSEAAAIRFTDVLKTAVDDTKRLGGAFANDLVSGIMSGKSAMDSLTAAASSLGKSLTSAGINNIIKDPTSVVGYVETGIGIVTSWLTGNSEKKKAEEAQRAAEAAAAAKAVQDGLDRSAKYAAEGNSSSFDTSTIAGQIAAFDQQSMQRRADEAKAGNQAIIALENDLAKQRQAIVDKANQAIAKSMNDFLNSIKTGTNSILSPEDQLKYAQAKFNTDVSAGQGGDQTALNSVTADAQNLLNIAKGFYASGTGYATVYQSVTDAITGLANHTNLTVGADTGITQQAAAVANPIGVKGYAAGGIVSNGTYGVDSVIAKLAGGEHITRSSSVNGSTRGALDYINRTGKAPGDNAEVVRVLTQGFNGQTQVLSDKLDAVAERIQRLENATRQSSNQRRMPGTQAA